jgi:hypothetical protein
LGSTPAQVFIDGIPQLNLPHVVRKPHSFQHLPEVPNFDKETSEAVEYEGLPPLEPEKAHSDIVIFQNVKAVFLPTAKGVQNVLSPQNEKFGVVIVQNGTILCSGIEAPCLKSAALVTHHILDLQGEICSSTILDLRVNWYDVKGGSISPGLVSFGSPLGLGHIAAEDSTNDGTVHDHLVKAAPKMIGAGPMVRTVDGLQFASRDAL